jgi:hypothetical protein
MQSEGISLWPTIFLRAAALMLCVLLFFHGFWALNKNMDTIASEIGLQEWKLVKAEQSKSQFCESRVELNTIVVVFR